MQQACRDAGRWHLDIQMILCVTEHSRFRKAFGLVERFKELCCRVTEKDSSRKTRLTYIDTCRGILFVLMTSSHTLSLLGISEWHWLSKSGLPRGWATVCFISLSGFSLGILFLPKIDMDGTAKRLVKRCWQLLIVMFFSNLFMLLMKHLIDGTFSVLREPAWWIGLVTLRTPYSISSILLPTALLVGISPLLLQAIASYSVSPVLAGVLVSALGVASIKLLFITKMPNAYYLHDILFVGGNGFFPLLPMILYGSIGVALGALCPASKRVGVSALMVACLGIASTSTTLLGTTVYTAILGPSRLVILLLLSVIMLRCVLLQHFARFLAVIGQYALFSFLLHRILLQTIHVLMQATGLTMAQEVSYSVYLVLTLCSIWCCCYLRLRSQNLNTLLKKFYL